MEKIEKGQQDMQEKISQVTKMVMSLTKGRGLLRIPVHKIGLYLEKNNDDRFVVLNPNNLCEQEKLRKNPSKRSEHINV